MRAQQGFFLIERTCPTCGGSGRIIKNPCKVCEGAGRVQRDRTLSVTIPPGVEDGTRIRLAGEGEAGLRGAPAGDLYVDVGVRPHPLFQRDGANIFVRVPLRMTQAALGGAVEVPVMDGGRAARDHPAPAPRPATSSACAARASPCCAAPRAATCTCRWSVETPQNLSKRSASCWRSSRREAAKGGRSSPESEGFFAKVKEFWDGLRPLTQGRRFRASFDADGTSDLGNPGVSRICRRATWMSRQRSETPAPSRQ